MHGVSPQSTLHILAERVFSQVQTQLHLCDICSLLRQLRLLQRNILLLLSMAEVLSVTIVTAAKPHGVTSHMTLQTSPIVFVRPLPCIVTTSCPFQHLYSTAYSGSTSVHREFMCVNLTRRCWQHLPEHTDTVNCVT
jgi:hypothetical protein